MSDGPDTILIVEARETVPWTKPDELEFDPQGLLPPLGRPSGEGLLGFGRAATFPAVLADGAVINISKDVLPQELFKAINSRDRPFMTVRD